LRELAGPPQEGVSNNNGKFAPALSILFTTDDTGRRHTTKDPRYRPRSRPCHTPESATVTCSA